MILLHSEGTIKQTLEAFLITPLTGATGVRLAADIPFQASTGEVHPAGDAERNYGPVVLIEQAEGVVVPSMEVDSTDDSNEPNATCTLYIVNSKGKEIGTVFERWVFSASLGEAITYGMLDAFNLRRKPLRDQETYTRIGTNILVQEAVGERAFGNEVDAGILLLDVPPIDPTNPEAVGANSWAATDHAGIAASSFPHLVPSAPIHVSDNDPRLGSLSSVGNLISAGSIIIGGDSDASGTDTVSLQTRGLTRLGVNNDGSLTIGDVSALASARINLTTKPHYTATVGRLWNWTSQTFAQISGPGGETDYDDDSMQLGYNNGVSGVKTVAGIANFGLSHEARFYTGSRFQTEMFWTWTSPDGSITTRPFGFDVGHTNGDTTFTMKGDIYLMRQAQYGGGQWGWLNQGDNGGIDLTFRSTSYIAFQNNNASAIRFANFAATGSIEFGYVNASDVVVIAPGGGAVTIPGVASIGTVDSGFFRINGDSDTHITSIFSGYLNFISNGTEKLRVSPDGVTPYGPLFFSVDNTYDLGKSAGTNFRPQDIYAGRNIIAATSFIVGTNQVVGARETGWTAGTGTANKGAFATYAGQNVSAGYVEAEAQATDDAVKADSQRIKALEDMARTHGLLN